VEANACDKVPDRLVCDSLKDDWQNTVKSEGRVRVDQVHGKLSDGVLQ
jgi:hypothetical protein